MLQIHTETEPISLSGYDTAIDGIYLHKVIERPSCVVDAAIRRGIAALNVYMSSISINPIIDSPKLNNKRLKQHAAKTTQA